MHTTRLPAWVDVVHRLIIKEKPDRTGPSGVCVFLALVLALALSPVLCTQPYTQQSWQVRHIAV